MQRLVELYNSTVGFLAGEDSDLCDDLKKNKNHLFYLADLYSEFNETQTRFQGKDITIIQAKTILLGFKVKIGIFKSSLLRRDYKYFSNIQQPENEEIQEKIVSDDDL